MRTRYILIFVLGIAALWLWQDTAFAIASDNRSILAGGTGLGGLFDDALFDIGEGLIQAANLVMFFMTIASFLMVSFGIEDEKKLMWQVMLGLGLAWNFGGALLDMGIGSDASMIGGTVQQYEFHLRTGGKSDILGAFVKNFVNNVVVPGAANILPICQKLLIILAVIQGTWDLSFKFRGDKIQFLLSKVLYVGFWLYLMDRWIWFMTALGDGFEMIGYLAGSGGMPDNPLSLADGIVDNAVSIFNAYWSKSSLSSPMIFVVNIIGMVVTLLCLLLTAIELTVAKIEFYTFALLTMPLLAFGVTEKFKFLTEKAIGAMANLAIKLACITFIASMAHPFIQSFAKDMETASDIWTDIGVLLQSVLASILIFWITKSIPALASGLLNGQPSLGGAGMREMATNAAAAPIAAAGMVARANQAAAQKGKTGVFGGSVTGTLSELGKAALNSRMPVQAFRGGKRQMERWNLYESPAAKAQQELYREAKAEEAQKGKGDDKAAVRKDVNKVVKEEEMRKKQKSKEE